ncbi:MAG: hypothetical protein Q8Q49_04715 [bacterium]|nr:hypothetical protein [bacterium]
MDPADVQSLADEIAAIHAGRINGSAQAETVGAADITQTASQPNTEPTIPAVHTSQTIDVRPAPNSEAGLRSFGLVESGAISDTERTVIFPSGVKEVIPVRPVINSRWEGGNVVERFTVFYPRPRTLIRIAHEFSTQTPMNQ